GHEPAFRRSPSRRLVRPATPWPVRHPPIEQRHGWSRSVWLASPVTTHPLDMIDKRPLRHPALAGAVIRLPSLHTYVRLSNPALRRPFSLTDSPRLPPVVKV